MEIISYEAQFLKITLIATWRTDSMGENWGRGWRERDSFISVRKE